MNKRKILIILFIPGMISSGLASLGIVDSSSNIRINSLDSKMDLQLLNTGEQPLQVVVESRNTSEFSLEGKNITLKPSIVENPENTENLYYLDGNYFELRTITLDLDVNRYRNDNNFKLPITVRGLKQTNSSYSISNRVVAVLDKTFDAEVDPLVPMDTKVVEEDSYKDPEVEYTYEEKDDKENITMENTSSDSNSSKRYKDGESQTISEDTGSDLTFLLVLGIIGTGIYIIRMI
ncbi:MAG: hypothetical protein H8Z69_03550 [Nanohaloarchaea archaeon]|nr:hypothetical protein [Candidatus Nanohaloarchaea archaeon]